MQRNIIVLVFLISLLSCRDGKNDISILEYDLDRIELSLASNTLEKIEKFQREYVMNPAKWGTQHYKAEYIVALADSLLREIHNSESLKPAVQSIIYTISDGIDLLKLQNEHSQLLREQRFNYWKNNEYFAHQRYSLAIDIRLCINDILDELYNQVDLNSFNFNVIKPIVIDSSNVVRVGETYTAMIGLLAYDSTCMPGVWMDEYHLDVQSGTGIYRASSNIPGEKRFGGKIKVISRNHEVKTLFYERTYEVK